MAIKFERRSKNIDRIGVVCAIRKQKVHVDFTVPVEWKSRIGTFLKETLKKPEFARQRIDYELSIQDPSTDTIEVDDTV